MSGVEGLHCSTMNLGVCYYIAQITYRASLCDIIKSLVVLIQEDSNGAVHYCFSLLNSAAIVHYTITHPPVFPPPCWVEEGEQWILQASLVSLDVQHNNMHRNQR